MVFGTPYLIGHNTVGTPVAQTITVTTGTARGDAILVATGNSSSANGTVSSITDSKGNAYTAATAAVVLNEGAHPWTSGGQNALTTSDTITVNFGNTTGTKACVAIGIPGAYGVSVDQGVSAHALSTAPSVTSGALAVASEIAIGIIVSATAGGVPSGLGSFTSVTTFQSGASPQMLLAYLQASATTGITFSGTIASATWAAFILTLTASGRRLAASQAVNRAATY